MIVSKKDGSNIYYPIEDVDAISFLQTDAIPESYIPSEKVICVDEYGMPITLKKKLVMSWGDSLTAGAGGGGTSYPKVLQSLLGDGYEVVNAGVGGETTFTISGRQGGSPMMLKNAVTLPADHTYVDVELTNAFGDAVAPLVQGGNIHINPCYVNGRKCDLKRVKDETDTYVYRMACLEDVELTIKASTPIVTNYMRLYRTPYILIIWIGQNGYYSNAADLADQIQRMIDYSGAERFLIIGMHMAHNIKCSSTLLSRYGDRFIDWAQYASTQGLNDAGIEPTEQDEIDMAKGICPTSLKSDNVHLNASGYTVLGKLVYDAIINMGW